MTTDLDTEFMSVDRPDYYIALSSKDGPYPLHQKSDAFLSKAKNVLVYAECLELSGTISLPGRNLALVCHELRLTGSDVVTIDVSGKDGNQNPATAAAGSGVVGENGQDAGSVFISVESPTAELTRLKVQASGGQGGRGGATADSAETSVGGKGGNGGAAGKITVLCNHAVHEIHQTYTQRLMEASTASWSRKINVAAEVLPPQDKANGRLPIIDLLADVSRVIAPVVPAARSAQRLLEHLKGGLSKYATLDVHAQLVNFLQTNSSANDIESRLQAELEKHTDKALSDQWLRLNVEKERLMQDVAQRLKSVPGNGGIGGASSSVLRKSGASGTDGTAIRNHQMCRYLPLPGDEYPFDLDVPSFYPDECRMLLKRADAEFMRNSKDSVDAATKLYERLSRRLYCVPELSSQAKSSTKVALTFTDTFEKASICMTPISELQGILNEARTRLSRIQLGQDMFGHNPIFAPRLSYFYYEKRIAEMITDYKSLTKELEKFRLKSGQNQDRRDAVASVRDLIQKESASAQGRLDAITSENGPMKATAYRVRSYDPKMKDQQRQLKAKMQDVASQIDSSINVNKLIDAVTTLASSSNKAEAAKNSLKAGYSVYQSVTVVEDADGQSFDKALLVKQIKSCGDTLESLSSAVTAGADGSVALEDPGAVKVLTTTENISKMLDQFRNVLPQSIRDVANTMLRDFVDTVLIRNNAVLEYNALSQSVLELRSMQKQQNATIEALSEQKLQKADPNLPFIVNWLRRTRDDFALSIMLYLNYASRAIRFWGLIDGLPMDRPGPLQGAVELEKVQRSLKSNFDTALNDYAAKSWSTFGAPDALGRVYQLPSQDLQRLMAEPRVEKGKKVYSLTVNLTSDASGMAGVGTSVRIHQVRLWLANAYVDTAKDGTNRQILTMTLTHTGAETIKKDDDKDFNFVHSPVKIRFQYHSGQVKSLQDAKAAAVYGTQIIENDFRSPTVSSANADAIAPLGPFTMWTVEIKESDNPGLDLSKVTGGWLEFWGRSKA